MASENEDGPCKELMKLDTSADTDAHSLNSLFPKIDNLEHFPLKVLLHIFEYVDDISLLNLAIESYRFEGIAKMVLNGRYATKYFVVKESDDDEMISDFFDRFGKEIKAIEAKISKMDDKDHWIASVLDNASNVQKLILDIREIKSNEEFLQQHVNVNITHLTIDMHTDKTGCAQFVAPDFRNLKQLAIGNYSVFSFESLKKLIRNNPGLESLCIGEKSRRCCDRNTTYVYPFVEIMEHIGIYLTELKVFSYVNDENQTYAALISSVPDRIIGNFINSLQNLESLTLGADLFVDLDVLLHRLGLRCARIKNLEFFCTNSNFVQLFDSVKSFENLQRLKLFESNCWHLCTLKSLIEQLSVSFLSLLQKCPSLENITVLITALYYDDLEVFGGIQFFIDRITKAAQKWKVKIQIEHFEKDLSYISNNQVTWQENLVLYLTKPAES